jgi:drug/metabolite transporter (DMT)-like permease
MQARRSRRNAAGRREGRQASAIRAIMRLLSRTRDAMEPDSTRRAGTLLAIAAAVMWGISGACAQFLFQRRGVDIAWLVAARLLIAGALLVMFAGIRNPSGVWRPWRTRGAASALIVFGLVGMLGVQYSYFAAIRHSNAATGTVLQYLGPSFIAIWLTLVGRRAPSRAEAAAILLAFVGTLLLVPHGEAGQLQITPAALGWGIGSAVALAFYTLQPVGLLKDNDAATVSGWGMLIGGLGCAGFGRPWQAAGTWDAAAVMAAAFVIVCGTLLAFLFYLAAIRRIGPQRTSLLACAEPLSAAIAAVAWLRIPFSAADALGSACILATIFILARKPRAKKNPPGSAGQAF